MKIFIDKIRLKFFNYFFFLLTLILLSFLIGCAAHTNLTPLGKGKIDAAISLGGPFIPVAETKIPTPYLSVGVNYGMSENINIDGNFHITPLFYKLSGFDFGATWFPTLNEGIIPTWGIEPRILMFASFKSDVESPFRIYPLISNSAAWQFGNGLIYTGFDLVIPATKPDYDKQAVQVIFSPFAGYRWTLSNDLRLLTELKWHGANVQSNQLAVDYITISGHGAFSLMLSLEKRF